MAKAMDPQMLRAIGGMQGIESMMKQMQQGGCHAWGHGHAGHGANAEEERKEEEARLI